MKRFKTISGMVQLLMCSLLVLSVVSCKEVDKFPKVPSTLNKESEVKPQTIQPIGYPPALKNAGNRTHASFYKWRPANGAPPFVPHEMDPKWKNSTDCLSCHKNGGFVMKWKKFTPPMPHEFMGECSMCHNPPFKGYVDTGLDNKSVPTLQNRLAPNAPPQIPHSIQMRKNCVSCHFGPTAIKEVLSSHEERPNCTMCHQLLVK